MNCVQETLSDTFESLFVIVMLVLESY